MSRDRRLILKILSGTSDANILFDDLCNLLVKMGFECRIRGSHHLFRREGIEEKINLQREGAKAKVYQVRQIRTIFLKYKLGENL